MAGKRNPFRAFHPLDLLGQASIGIKFLLAFMITAAIPLLVLAWSNDRTMQAAVEAAAEQKLLTISQQKALSVDRLFAQHIDVIRMMAQLPTIETSFQRSTDEQADGYQEARATLEALARGDPLHLIRYQLLDKQGTIIADSTNTTIGENRASEPYFREALRSGLPYASPVIFPAQTSADGAFLAFSSPVRNSKRETVGVIAAHYQAALLQTLLTENNDPDETQPFSVLFDEHLLRIATGGRSEERYTLVAPLDPTLFSQLQATGGLPTSAVNLAQSPLPGLAELLQQSSAAPTALLGEYQSARTQLTQQPWQLVTFQPHSIALRPVQAQRWAALRFSLVVLGLMIALALLVSSRFAHPIRQLSKVVTQVSAGDFSAQATYSRHDEFGALAQGLNHMTQELRQNQEGLERQIAQRTDELTVAMSVQSAQAQNLRMALLEQQQLSAAVLQLPVPVIPALQGTLVIPLLGTFTAERGQQLASNVLQQSKQQHAKVIIFDLTGVPLIDPAVGHMLVQLASSLQLLGTRSVLVGVRPEIAQTMVDLQLDLSLFQLMPTLQQALGSMWATDSR